MINDPPFCEWLLLGLTTTALVGCFVIFSSRRRASADSNLFRKVSERVPGVVYQFIMRPDGSFCFPFASQQLEEIYEVSPSDVKENISKVTERIHPEDVERVIESILKSAANLSDWTCEYRVNLPKRGERWLFGNSVPERVSGGGVLWHGFITDVTERKLAEQQLLETNKSLQETTVRAEELARTAATANSAKGEFLAMMSHEIRTPMNGVMGMADLLRCTELDESQRAYVDAIVSSGRALLTIIDDVLDFSKIESGKLMLNHEPFDLAALLDQLRVIMQVEAETKGIGFHIEVDAAGPLFYIGDVDRLRQIILNLLSNAIKFTGKGEVRLFVSSTPGKKPRAEDDLLELRIRDTGIGIAADKIPFLFKKFQQLDSGISRQYGGTGLGLAISRQLTELMGGQISVSSVAGEGSEFVVSLPLPIADPSAVQGLREAPQVNTAASGALPPRHKILVIEDNLINREVTLKLLKRMGEDGYSAIDGEVALQLMAGRKFDLILMDIHLPRMNGFEVTDRIRTGDDLATARDVPIVAVTANALDGDRERCIKAGMNDYLAKPVRAAEVQQLLHKYLA